jgi:hypothetical protein
MTGPKGKPIAAACLWPVFIHPIQGAEPKLRQFVHDAPLMRIGCLMRQREAFCGALMIKFSRGHFDGPYCPLAMSAYLIRPSASVSDCSLYWLGNGQN